MNTDTQGDAAAWSQEIARITARIDHLKGWFERECQLLQANLDVQIAEVRNDLKRLQAEVTAAQPGAYALRVAAQIEELKAKGDAAYEQLQAQFATGDRASVMDHPHM
jgi:hypothetical protein